MKAPFTSWRPGVAVIIAVVLLQGFLPGAAGFSRAPSPTPVGYGTGVLPVNGSATAGFSLPDGGTYYLAVAPDGGSSYVDARVMYNGSLAAELNESTPAANFVSLAAGNYTMNLTGRGRAALGWDFTDGTVQDFPDNESVTGFLRPSTAHLAVTVSIGNALAIHLAAYDDSLVLVNETTVTTSITWSIDLPASHASFALLAASVLQGSPTGVFGLAWSSPAPPTPGADLGSQTLAVVLWIGVPIVLALLAFVFLRRRRAGIP